MGLEFTSGQINPSILDSLSTINFMAQVYTNGVTVVSTKGCGRIMLCTVRVNSHLERLWLTDNEIDDRGARALADVLRNYTGALWGLWLDGNNISTAGYSEFNDADAGLRPSGTVSFWQDPLGFALALFNLKAICGQSQARLLSSSNGTKYEIPADCSKLAKA